MPGNFFLFHFGNSSACHAFSCTSCVGIVISHVLVAGGHKLDDWLLYMRMKNQQVGGVISWNKRAKGGGLWWLLETSNLKTTASKSTW